MSYLIRECEGEALKLEAAIKSPFGPGFSPELIAKAKKIRVTGSAFTDPGGDWTRFDLLDSYGYVFASRQIAGY